jgi:hypothetical protein
MLSIQSSARVVFLAVLVGAAAALLGAQPAGAQFTTNEINTNVTRARSVFAADVDGDDDIDVLSAESFERDTDIIAWFENDGSGNFTGRVIRNDADDVRRVHAADVDGDDDIDVLSAEEDDDDIFWYENDGNDNPSFTDRRITSNADGATSVFTADVDGDGATDVLSAAENGSGSIDWYENDGTSNPSFTTRNIGSLSGATSVYAADLDGDGDPDVIAGNWDNNETPKVVWYENKVDADGSFGPAQTILSTSGNESDQRDVHAADVDGDGDTDVLSASHQNDAINWYENDGSGNFTTHNITTSADDARGVYTADVDGDGHTDVVSASSVDDKIAWYENDGASDPSFTAHTITTDALSARGVYAADVDGDGHTDVLSASYDDNTVAWYENGVTLVANDDAGEGYAPCNSTSNRDDTSVSGAISLANSGQNVRVCPGTYSESTLDVNRQVTFESGADVTITDELTLTGSSESSNDLDVSGGTLTLKSTGESSSARIAGSGSGTITGEVTAERFIEYQDGSSDGSHWRLMASPFGGALDEVDGGGGGEHDTYSGSPLLSNTWTQGGGMTGANYQGSGADASVFYYEESRDVSNANDGWTEVGDLTNPTGNSNIGRQEGFAVSLFRDRDFDGNNEGFPITLSATGSASNLANINDNTSGATTLPVTCTDSDGSSGDGCNDSNDGWNLVANPFVSHFDWSDDTNVSKTALKTQAYVYDADNNEYDQTDGTNGGDKYIAPFQAFFVKSNAADGNEGTAALSVNSGAKADPGTSGDAEFKSLDAEPLVSLQLRNSGAGTEETRITYRNGAEIGEDRFDGYQLTPLSGNYHFLASEMSGREVLFDSQYRPAPTEQDTIDLALDITEGGTYTLETDTLRNLPGDWKVILENTESGARWDLGAGQSATFSVEVPQSKSTAETTSPAELLKNGPTVAKASTDGDLPSYRLYVGPSAALPVELASFDARTEGTDVRLSWQTASETGNAGFTIERRVGARERGGESAWTEVGFVEGSGTTEQARTYQFTDAEVPFEAEQVQYRLRQKDLDGATILSDKVVVELGAPSTATLHAPFPNPASQQATLRYEVPEGLQGTSVEIALYNMLGQRVRTVVQGRTEPGREEVRLDVSDLSSGPYFLRMRAGPATKTKQITVVR